MKKVLFIVSLLLMTLWIAGVFLWHLAPAIHIVLVLAVLVYIRSLLTVEANSRVAQS